VIEALLDDILDAEMIEAAVDEALRLVRGDDSAVRIAFLDAAIGKAEQECSRLVAAIAAGGELGGLVDALRSREERRKALERPSGRDFAPVAAPRLWTRPLRDEN
jgi:hypothetical protein